MTIALDISSDLQNIVDGLQAVTVRHAASGASESITGAFARRLKHGEAAPSGGTYTADDVRWHLPAGVLGEPLAPSDEVTDAAGDTWIVQDVRQVGLDARVECVARKLAIAPGPNDTVRLQQASWSKDQAGAPVVAWNDVATELLARIQPHRGTIEVEHNRRQMRVTHEIYLAEPITIDSNHRLVDETGRAYKLVGYAEPERIDRLSVIYAVLRE